MRIAGAEYSHDLGLEQDERTEPSPANDSDPTWATSLGRSVREKRAKCGLSMRALCIQLKCSPATLWRIEHDLGCEVDLVVRIHKLTLIPYAELLGGADVHHTCHWPGCLVRVPPKLWGCKAHWFRLPKELRDAIWATYVRGQELTKKPSREYIAAAEAVQAWIRTVEVPAKEPT